MHATVWRYQYGVLIAAIITVLALILTGGLLRSVHAQGVQVPALRANLSGDAEVPPVATTATGSLDGRVADNVLEYTLSADAQGITQAHIHVGGASENGPVVAFLFGLIEAGEDGINVSGTITESDLVGPLAGDFGAFLSELTSGNTYVNVHTVMYPPGEVRGQIVTAVFAEGGPDGLPDAGSGGLADTGNRNADRLPWVTGGLAAALAIGIASWWRSARRRM